MTENAFAKVLCQTCKQADEEGNAKASRLIRAALEASEEEVGPLTLKDSCPLSQDGEGACPFVARDGLTMPSRPRSTG